ncbi:MAG TPA: HEAT repeat domain-containing protein [Gemmatimonadales bacterium]|nr:HEAT repeat domain-containing protein [Gemmatimonadales bacterium]
MIIPVVFATHLARAVDLFRDPAKKDEQKREFRILVGMLKGGNVAVRIIDDVLVVNDQRVIAPEFRPLVQSMVVHGVTELVIPSDAPVSHLFELLRALADHPAGSADIAARLRSSGADRVSVVLSQIDESEEGASPATATGGTGGARDLGTRGVLRGEPVKDLRSSPVAGADGVESVEQNLAQPSEALPVPEAATPSQAIIPRQSGEIPPPGLPATPLESVAPAPGTLPPPPPPPPPPPKRTIDSAAPTFTPATPAPPLPHAPPPPPASPPHRVHTHSGSVLPPSFGEAPQDEAPAPPPPAEPEIAQQAASPLFALREALSKDTADMLSALEANPAPSHVGEMLTVLTRQIETVMRQGKIEQAMQIVYRVVRAEQHVEDAAVRRQYGIALRRMITKQMLDGLSKLVQVPHLEDAAGAVLQRAGPDGVEVLLDLLTTSNTVTERRGVFSALIQALKEGKEGQDQLVHMLGHPQWFVVRNVADLVGELQLEAAVPALTKQLEHDDERVRRQVALALAKIGTRSAAEPLRRALRDSSADVRRQAALGVGGRKASALAMPLVVALDDEKDPEVVRELIFALGRIGSPDAVQALIKLAQPSGKLFNRKPSVLRVTAVEALRVAGTPTAISALQSFAADGDKQVRAAVLNAMSELSAKQRS